LEESQNIVIALQNKLRTEARDVLLDPLLWHSVLEEYALAMNLAVVLTDAQGRMLGECINPQPLWSLFNAQIQEKPDSCPFCLIRSESCTASLDAIDSVSLILPYPCNSVISDLEP
jgi:ligand-binding sensor protein